ncbi:hypothetical protein [Streptomyces afghaniensis]|uniref:hypothetical protein n=1 Tax=Streptomyces afghaniensis TaxID=66865 RepID=UPI0037AF4C34
MWVVLLMVLMIVVTAAIFLVCIAATVFFLYFGWQLSPWYGLLSVLMVICGWGPMVARMFQRTPGRESD